MKIKTFKDLITIGEKIADIVGKGTTEVNIIVSEEEYKTYVENPENSFESYMNENPTVPIFHGVFNEVNKKQPLISFHHRSGVKVTLNKVKTDIYR